MKRKSNYFIAIVALVLLTACATNEANVFVEDESVIENVSVSAKEFVSPTRILLDEDTYQISWSEKDAIGVFPSSGSQMAFMLTEGVKSSNASFNGNGWKLDENMEYAAYYPYINDGYLKNDQIPLDYTRQQQNGNNSSTHISAYDYMFSQFLRAQAGKVHFQFNHAGALMHLKLNVPAGEYVRIIMETDKGFYTQATLNLKGNETVPVENSLTQSIVLDLNGTTVDENGLLSTYMMLYPVDLTDGNITAKIYDVNGICHSVTWSGMNIKAGSVWQGFGTADEAGAEFIEISLNTLHPEIINTPMTRASSSDLYCIEARLAGSYDTSSSVFWLTDDLGSSTIRLKKGCKYTLHLVYVPDGKNILHQEDENHYGNPFNNVGPEESPYLNRVCYGSGYAMYYARMGAAQRKGKSYLWQANVFNDIDVYYGYTEIEAKTDETINIDLYEMMYGLKINAVNLTEGKLRIFDRHVGQSSKIVDNEGGYVYELTPSNTVFDKVLELYYMPWAEQILPMVDYIPDIVTWSSDLQLGIEYISPEGDPILIYTKDLNVKRMTKYTLTIDVAAALKALNGESVNESISSTLIESQWSEVEVQ